MIALAAIGIGAFSGVASRIARNPLSPPPASADSLDAMTAQDAYMRGVAFTRRNLPVQALPYFRRALALRPDLWQVHSDYAATLLNAMGQSRATRGVGGPSTRSSRERVDMIRDALGHLEQAESLTRTPEDHVTVLGTKARFYSNWGLAWESLLVFRQARALAPGVPEVAHDEAIHLKLMRGGP